MIAEAKLPMYFWAEAVTTSCYTRNRTLINKDHMKTPFQLYTNKKPYVKHLHVFGAKCYVLKDGEEHLNKFEPKAYEAIFVGYTNAAYKVFMIDTLLVKVSVNVTFDDT